MTERKMGSGVEDGHVIDQIEIVIEGEIVALHHLLITCILIEVPYPIEGQIIDHADVIGALSLWDARLLRGSLVPAPVGKDVVKIDDVSGTDLVVITRDHDAACCRGDAPNLFAKTIILRRSCGVKRLIHQRLANAIPDLLALMLNAKFIYLLVGIRLGEQIHSHRAEDQCKDWLERFLRTH